ncbi:hypothetical protein FEM48_Zijuj03G0021100 [Ziziphus jujuba var. spinosa]|uniref:Uncharacterized protein n=1 Tax=Ziziphus jujuba var. spinosa TaxID=714518 RepID=A0A978VMI9_ZIZJJ|nr:hypothetical protein FEM48_Zijuj03G0021100 [Ziziphus jujuba var. spinosa]
MVALPSLKDLKLSTLNSEKLLPDHPPENFNMQNLTQIEDSWLQQFEKAKWNCQYEIDHEGLNDDDQEQAGIFPGLKLLVLDEVTDSLMDSWKKNNHPAGRAFKNLKYLVEFLFRELCNEISKFGTGNFQILPSDDLGEEKFLKGAMDSGLDEDGELLLEHYEFSSFPVQQLEEGDINAAIRKLWLNNQGRIFLDR